MKKLLILCAISSISLYASAQCSGEAAKPGCDKTACGPSGTKKDEAAVISHLRSDLQAVIEKMSASSLPFDRQVAEMDIARGSSDDESLLYISQAAATIRHELLTKIDPSRVIASLKDHKPGMFSTKQQLVAALKKEVALLATQAEKL